MLSINSGFTGLNFQSSYAINNMFYTNIIAAFVKMRLDSKDFNCNLGELSVGYNKVLYKKRVVIFESSKGYGLASVDDKGFQGNFYGHISSNYHKFYIQPSIGVSTDYFDGALKARITAIKYLNNEDYVKPLESTEYYSGMTALIEPIATIRAGYKFIKLLLQVGFSISLNNLHQLALQGFSLIANIGFSGHITTQKIKVSDPILSN